MRAPGVLMVDLRGLELAADERVLLQRGCVGGVVLFARNFAGSAQLRELTAAVRDCAPEVLIAVDQEGGRVQRFRDGFTPLPALRRIGELYEADPGRGLEFAEDCGWVMASEIVAAGLDFSFAPVLDLYDPASPVIGDRAFSANPDTVAELAVAYIKGMARAGMAAVGKHFPGHGLVDADSHVALPVDERSDDALRAADLRPFFRCHELLGGIMPAHVIYPALCSSPAGYSRYWLQTVLRGETGFDGVIFSDDLSMAAAHSAGSVEQRLESAIVAGCDMLLVLNAPEDALRAADYLERNHRPTNSKLARMRARPQPESRVQDWRKVAEKIQNFPAGRFAM